MRTNIVSALLLTCLSIAIAHANTASEASSSRPNIVIIMADDLGFSDIGCYGSEIATPNLDALASGGLRFTQFYNAARCCPTRAALLTGLYPHQAGIGEMLWDQGRAGYRGRIGRQTVTIAEVLAEAGYRTYMAGKWHVGEHRPYWPLNRGFERYFGLISGACNYWRLDPGRTMAVDDQPYTPEADDFYMTDAFSDAAVRFIREHDSRKSPFFLYVPYTAPHWPLHAWPEDIERYRGRYKAGWDALRQERYQRMIDMGLIDARWKLTERDPEAPAWNRADDSIDWSLRMAVYAAQIDRMDQGIGRIIEALEDENQLDNTLIMFLADNGGCAEWIDRGQEGVPPGSEDSFLSYGLPWANASNTPFAHFKKWTHEGGIASPLIAHWPARIREGGQLTGQVGHVIDLMATCVDVADASYPATCQGTNITPLEGKSLLPIFEGKQRAGHDILCWEHLGNRAIRKDEWKLVAEKDGPWELYNLHEDRTETNNLIDKHPDLVNELLERYQTWVERCHVYTREELSDPDPLTQCKLIEVRKIWDAAPHNAFTDLVEYGRRWYCTFREADTHAASQDGTIRVIVSPDKGKTWASAALIKESGVDLRDPKLSVTPDGELMLLCGGSVYKDRRYISRRPRVAFSRDGRQWTKLQPILEEGDWLWRVTWHRGVGYGVSYRGRGGGPLTGDLCSSRDGRTWQRITTFDIAGVTEVTLRFTPHGKMLALVRREDKNAKSAFIGTSQPPYTDWQWNDANHRLGGPEFIRLYDGSYWAAGRWYEYEAGPKTVLARMTESTLTPILTLPSGGDTSYPAMLWDGELLHMTYYASHEGKAAIYQATMRMLSDSQP
jgi:arylsulfatase